MTGTNDKLRGLFLAMLMVMSVFAGTVALSGTAAAANDDPEVVKVVEDGPYSTVSGNTAIGDDQISVVFDDQVQTASGNAPETVDGFFTLYVRQAGSDDRSVYSIDAADVQVQSVGGGPTAERYVIDTTSVGGGLDDFSPGDDVKINVGEVEPTSNPLDENEQDPGNVTVQTPTKKILQGGTEHNVRKNALTVYQGETLLFEDDDDDGSPGGLEREDSNILLENLDTGETVLDGSTGVASDEIAFNTDNLESGTTYRLEFERTGEEKFFNVTDLRLSASIDEDGTVFDYDEDAEFELSGDAVRGRKSGRTLQVAVEIVGNDSFNQTLDYRGDASFEEDYDIDDGNINASDYTVDVIDIETGIEVSAGQFTVEEFPEADSASFGPAPSEDRGDVAEIPIQLSNSEEGATATVAIGSKAQTNYVTNVTAVDENGDGEIVLEFNTFMAGISANSDENERFNANDGGDPFTEWNQTQMTGIRKRIFTAEGADTVSSWRGENGTFISDLEAETNDVREVNNTAKVATIDPASYTLRVKANDEGDLEGGFNFTDDGADADDVSTLNLRARTIESSNIWVAPSALEGEITFGAIDEAVLDNTDDPIDGNVTLSDQAAEEEVVIQQISASGVEGVIRNRTEAGADNATIAYLREINASATAPNIINDDDLPSTGGLGPGNAHFPAFNASIREANPGPNAQRQKFKLSPENFTVIPDYQNDTYYLVTELSGVNEDKLEDEQNWEAQFGYLEYGSIGPNIGGEQEGTAESVWTYLEADATLDTNAEGLVILRNKEDQFLSGDTNVAPGTELTIRVQSLADDGAFLETLDTRVGPDRSFNKTTDVFSDKSAGINITAQVLRGGDEISDEYDGLMLGTATATVSFSDQVVADSQQEVVVDSATLSDGGFVAIHRGSATGPVIGTSKKLGPGTHSNIRVDLDQPISSATTLVAMPHLDTDDDNAYEFTGGAVDKPYTTNGAPVTSSATVTLDTPTPTPTATPTDTPEPTTAPPTDTPEPETETPTPTEADTPEPTTTSQDGPGFGVAVSVLALLAAALLAARRRE